MRVTSVSANYPIRPLFTKKQKSSSLSFGSKSGYQTQNEREYLLSTLSKVNDLTPNSAAGFQETLAFLRDTNFDTYSSVIHTLGRLPQGSVMKYSALDATTSATPFKRSHCLGVKVNFDINPSSSQKTYNASEERYGANLSSRSIAANVVVENTASYLENKAILNPKELIDLKTMKQYISNNSTTYYYMPII